MSHPIRANRVAAALACALALAVPSVAAAKPQHPPCGKAKPAHTDCRKHKGKGKRRPKPRVATTPVTAELLDGSVATVDIPAVPLPGGYVLPGTPVTRTIPLSGWLKGGIRGGYQLNRDNTINFTTAAIGLGAGDLLTDADCGGAPVLRLNPASGVALAQGGPSRATVFKDGRVRATVNVALALATDSRAAPGCATPLTTMGTATTTFPLTVTGMIQRGTGLTALELATENAVPVSVSVCLTPGAATSACASPPVAYPVSIAVRVRTKVFIG